jgi:hypothetical protein
MPTTIPTAFEPDVLPRWAQAWPQVVWLSERDLSFRAEVFRADTSIDPAERHRVIKEACRRYRQIHDEV